MIPRYIHHVWPGQDPFRAEFHDFRASWMKHHPDWTFMFWRGNDAIDDPRVRDVLDHTSYSVIVKSDILRLYALTRMGGLYVDTDFECLKPFDDLLASGGATGGFHCGWQDHANLCPSLMACAAGDPFAQKYLDAALAALENADANEVNRRPDVVTGPGLLTRLGAAAEITRHAREVFYPPLTGATDAYARHYFFGSTPTGWLGSQTAVAPSTGDLLRFDLGGIGRGGDRKTVNLISDCDVRTDIIELDRFCQDGTVTEFFLSHTLEHVPSERYETFLRDMVRKLRPGGVIRIVQTDADAVIRQYARGELGFRSMRSTLFTPPDRLVDNPHQAHRNCWSAVELAKDLAAVGLHTELFDAGCWGIDMTDPFYPGDVHADWGKPIKNLGVLGRKPDVVAYVNEDWRYSEG